MKPKPCWMTNPANQIRREMPDKSWKVGLQKLGPGVYSDANGGMHLDAVELCVAAGCRPTAANQQMLAEAAQREFAKYKVPFNEIEHGKP